MTRKVKFMIAVPLAMVAVVALFAVVGLVEPRRQQLRQQFRQLGGGRRDVDRPGRPGERSRARAGDGRGRRHVHQEHVRRRPAAARTSRPPSRPPPRRLRTTCCAPATWRCSSAAARCSSTVDRIKAMTTAMNGYVMSSAIGSQAGAGPIEPMPMDTAVSSDGSGVKGSASAALTDPYASLVVRVPEQYFETAIKRFSKLGEVQSASTSSEDVTSQYVDLRARLHHYRAVERRLIGFLSRDDQREPDAGRPEPHRRRPAHHRGAHRPAQVAARDHHLRHAVGLRVARRTGRRRRSTPATPSAARSGTPSTCSATAPA